MSRFVAEKALPIAVNADILAAADASISAVTWFAAEGLGGWTGDATVDSSFAIFVFETVLPTGKVMRNAICDDGSRGDSTERFYELRVSAPVTGGAGEYEPLMMKELRFGDMSHLFAQLPKIANVKAQATAKTLFNAMMDGFMNAKLADEGFPVAVLATA